MNKILIFPLLLFSMLQSFAQGKYGVMDSTLQWVIHPTYDEIIAPGEGLIISADSLIASKDGRFGLIDIHNNVLIPFEYMRYDMSRGNIFKMLNNDHKWGIVKSGEIVLPFEYEEIDYYLNESKPYLVEKLNDEGVSLSGCIDKNSLKVILPLVYQHVLFKDSIILARKSDEDNSYGIFDYSGKQLSPFEYESRSESYTLSPDLSVIVAEKNISNDLFKYSYLLLDMDGEPLSDVYDEIRYLNEPLFSLAEDDDKIQCCNMFLVTKDGKQGVLDSLAHVTIPCLYDEIKAEAFYNNYFPVRRNGKWGVIDTRDNLIVPFKYDGIKLFDNNVLGVLQGNQWSLTDLEGHKLLKETYEYIWRYSDEAFVIKRSGKWGVIDHNGSFIIPPLYENINVPYDFQSKGFLEVAKDGKKGLINHAGQVLLPTIYDEISSLGLSGNLCLASIDGKFGVLDFSNNQILPFEYSRIMPTDNDSLLVVFKDQYSALIDISGNLKTEFKYESIWQMSDDLFLASLDHQYYSESRIINKEGVEMPLFNCRLWPIFTENKLYYIVCQYPE